MCFACLARSRCCLNRFVVKLHMPKVNLLDQSLAEQDAAEPFLRGEEDIKQHGQLNASELPVGPDPDVGFESSHPLPALHIDLSDLLTEIENACASSE
eukprot:m.153411 g.153411  ORF g.153411 m.153411 type:complete len:98 (-) comp52858_c1_seq5:99-392(-)